MLKFSGSSYLIGGPMFNFRFYLRTNYLNTTKKLSHNTEVSHYSMSFITNYLASSPNLNTLMHPRSLQTQTHQNAKLRTHSLTQSSQLPQWKKHHDHRSNNTTGEWWEQTLQQACSQEYPEAQHAFKNLMIHWILQFALRIAFRCVLHRCENQEIHC